MHRPGLLGRDTTHKTCSIFNSLFAMEGSLTSSEALADDLCVLVNPQVFTGAVVGTRTHAKLRPGAGYREGVGERPLEYVAREELTVLYLTCEPGKHIFVGLAGFSQTR